MHGKFRLVSTGKASSHSTALPSLFFLCAVFSCFRNPPNSDIDYRIFDVRTRSFLCVSIHTGVGHTDNESTQHFDSEKLTNFYWAPDGDRTSGLWISSRCCTNWATPPPRMHHVVTTRANPKVLSQVECVGRMHPQVWIQWKCQIKFVLAVDAFFQAQLMT